MFRKLVKVTEIEVDGTGTSVEYFEHQTLRGSQRFSCEVLLDATDRIILDDDSLASLESRSSGWRRRRSTAGCSPRARRSSRPDAVAGASRLENAIGPLATAARVRAAPGAESPRAGERQRVSAHPTRAGTAAPTCGAERRLSTAWRCAP